MKPGTLDRMSLAELWRAQPDQLGDKQVDQLVAIAGEGKLRDNSLASREFREFLRNIPSSLLRRYSQECLDKAFPDSGLALQDITNEVGHRLGFRVQHGRYRGSPSVIGFDGLWMSRNNGSIVVEVKTTDAYRIKLDTLAGYRRSLKDQGRVSEGNSSILIVVGRQDTGDLEAQIRGSRYAWDVRLISVEYLMRLLSVREDVEDPQTEERIRSVLVPKEFTRVDEIIDLVFSATEDIQQEERAEEDEKEEEAPTIEHKKLAPVSFHEACVQRIASLLQKDFLRRSRAKFSTPDDDVRLVCAVSKEHRNRGRRGYWYAVHPHQLEFLASASDSSVAFGCGSPDKILLIRFETFRPWLEQMNQTHTSGGRSYWHVQVHLDDRGRFFLQRRGGAAQEEITSFLLSDTESR